MTKINFSYDKQHHADGKIYYHQLATNQYYQISL
jgi:hypothetical protein